MGEQAPADVVSMHVKDNEKISIENINLTALYTPGHTDDSYSFLMNDRLFTGDTLLIKGTGRTDFQNGNPYDQYNSLFDRLLKLPEETFIYPAHDYKGENVSTIGEEKKFNPRLQVSSAQEYALIMNNLNLSNPKMMDIAVPENKKMGLSIEKQIELSGITYDRFKKLSTNNEVVLIDLRESIEIKNIPSLENSINVPYTSLQEYLKKDKEKLKNKTVVFYCAVGERSALAVQASQSYNFRQTYHLAGGLKNL